MNEMQTVGQRFSQLISHLGITKNAFAASLGKTATVIQHLVDERNKPGFDLLCVVFEIYPNVSKDWLLQGVGPMLNTASSAVAGTPPTNTPSKPRPTSEPAPDNKHENPPTIATTDVALPLAQAPAATPTIPTETAQTAPNASAAPATADAFPPPTALPLAAASTAMPGAPAADSSWQTALYTQQMAHQLALAELRNQHLQDQQRMMQQMLDLMQRQLPR